MTDSKHQSLSDQCFEASGLN
ncbi:MAG: hypothetical protein RLZZ11_2028, partial [Cyanobacteriota bacterium]